MAGKKNAAVPVLNKPPELKLAKAPLMLDLACGQNLKQGFEGVDLLAPGVKHKFDLLKFPWPIEDESCSELFCSHFIEHIPLRDVEGRDITKEPGNKYLGEDMLLAFFDECYRIIKPDGVMTVICPSARNERGFQDPTHRRFIVQATFFYLDSKWREANGLNHYRVSCDWTIQNISFTILPEAQTLHPEVQQRKFSEAWNQVFDYTCVLKPRKGNPSSPEPGPCPR